jgi:hypothetical protein
MPVETIGMTRAEAERYWNRSANLWYKTEWGWKMDGYALGYSSWFNNTKIKQYYVDAQFNRDYLQGRRDAEGDYPLDGGTI